MCELVINHSHKANVSLLHQSQTCLAVSNVPVAFPLSPLSLIVTQNLWYFRFWASLVPMMYFFVQHKVHQIPGGMFFH
jgi:hypothetical protein